jgi:hypothetical protein
MRPPSILDHAFATSLALSSAADVTPEERPAPTRWASDEREFEVGFCGSTVFRGIARSPSVMITNVVTSAANLKSQFETVDRFPAKRLGGDLSRWSRAPNPPEKYPWQTPLK